MVSTRCVGVLRLGAHGGASGVRRSTGSGTRCANGPADPTLQLIAPLSLCFGAYRVIDMVPASTTVGEGVRRFARFFHLIADTATLHIQEEDGEHRLCLAMGDGGPVPPVYVDYGFAGLVGRIRMRGRVGLRPRCVELRRPEPPAAGPYTGFFRARVRFGAPADRLCFTDVERKLVDEGTTFRDVVDPVSARLAVDFQEQLFLEQSLVEQKALELMKAEGSADPMRNRQFLTRDTDAWARGTMQKWREMGDFFWAYYARGW